MVFEKAIWKLDPWGIAVFVHSLIHMDQVVEVKKEWINIRFAAIHVPKMRAILCQHNNQVLPTIYTGIVSQGALAVEQQSIMSHIISKKDTEYFLYNEQQICQISLCEH